MDWENGLSEGEAGQARLVYGRNEVKADGGIKWYGLLLSQLSSPLVYVLLTASVISFLFRDRIDALVILIAVILNTIFGFVQEYRAEKSMEALSKLLTPRARVKRGDDWAEIDAALLVPGDVVKLTIGWKVPADGLLIVEDDMYLNEAIISGESVPVKKKTWKTNGQFTMNNGEFDKTENDFKGFMGTIVERGVGVMLVVKTGVNTRMGMIVGTVKEVVVEKTPLQKKLEGLTKQLTSLVVVTATMIFILGLVSGRPVLVLLSTVVALAVAAIPEGLVVGLTVILAVGMKRILEKKAVVRGLMAAETLGGVNVVCLDKTGTITEGKMSAVGAISSLSESTEEQIRDEGLHDKEKIGWLARGALWCNDLRDPLEIAMRDWAVLYLKKGVSKHEIGDFRRLDEIPFDHKHKYIVTRHISMGNKNEVVEFLSGAPEVVLTLSKVASAVERRNWNFQFEELGSKGYRMVAMAMKKLPKKEAVLKIRREAVLGYRWLGLIIFEDPMRKGVAESLREFEGAGIAVKVITGDYKETAWAVVKRAGLAGSDQIDPALVMTGEEMTNLVRDEKKERIKKAILFARTSPEQKLEIITSLQESGLTVAMMGDGVNDVPALKKADIGIAMNNASDLAREVADLVLLDNNFDTILAAVEEGRGIYDNLRKVLLYLLSDSFAGIVVIVLAVFLGWPLPLLATQILWVNLISDGFPYMALTIEPKAGNLLTRKIIRSSDPILDKRRLFLVGIISLFAGLLTLGGYAYNYYVLGSGLILSRTVAFAILGTCSLFYVFSCRSLDKPIWKDNFFKNPALVGAVIGGWSMLLLAIYAPPMQKIFETVSLSFSDWFWVMAAGAFLIFLIETVKAVKMESWH